MELVIGELAGAATGRNNDLFLEKTVESIRKLYEVTKEQASFVNRHAELHESHHRSFFNAQDARTKLRNFVITADNEVKQTKNDMKIIYNNLEQLVKRHDALHREGVEPIKDAIQDLNQRIIDNAKEVEHSRNKIFNIESRTSGAFDKIAEEIK